MFFSDAIEEWITITSTTCAIFFPEDAHAPLATNDKIKKLVIKIKV
jgi:beta-galactosidase beta subunit